MKDFLDKHPTPWRYESLDRNHDGRNAPGDDFIFDANGNVVLQSGDVDGYMSSLVGAEDLVDFVNSFFVDKTSSGMEYIYWVRYKVRASVLSGKEWEDTDTQPLAREDAVTFAERVNRDAKEHPNSPHDARLMRKIIGPEEEVPLY